MSNPSLAALVRLHEAVKPFVQRESLGDSADLPIVREVLAAYDEATELISDKLGEDKQFGPESESSVAAYGEHLIRETMSRITQAFNKAFPPERKQFWSVPEMQACLTEDLYDRFAAVGELPEKVREAGELGELRGRAREREAIADLLEANIGVLRDHPLFVIGLIRDRSLTARQRADKTSTQPSSPQQPE